jgi:hypothetical protein
LAREQLDHGLASTGRWLVNASPAGRRKSQRRDRRNGAGADGKKAPHGLYNAGCGPKFPEKLPQKGSQLSDCGAGVS